MAIIALKIFDAVPVRLNLWIMLFTGCAVTYMLRVNISLSLIAMVPRIEQNSTTSTSQCGVPDEALRNRTIGHADISDVRQAPRHDDIHESSTLFDWTPGQQALVLGSYYWCYPVTSLIGGMVAERWGPRYVVLGSTLISGVLTGISPLAARLHYIALIAIRLILGAAGGLIYPALHALIAQWIPTAEKGKFISALMGGTLGTVATWSVIGPLISKFGWESSFYLPAAITIAWCLLWWYLIADTPSDHPRISDAERKYLVEALGNKVKKSAGLPPFKSIATSVPFLAMVVIHFGNLWGLYFIMTVGPKFVSTVLGFQLSAAGVISALPYLGRLIFATIFGFIGDCILTRNLMSTTAIRKFFCLFSHIIPGVLLVLMVYAGCSTALSVSLITLSMGFNGAATLTNLQNHQDLAPNYAGTLYGIANAIGSTTGFFTPMITAYFTKNGNGYDEWRPVFFIGAAVYIVSAIFFILFGTGVTQPWNYPVEEPGEEKQDKLKNGTTQEMREASISVISK